MEAQTKQRILGALVFIAILAIILPLIFRNTSSSHAKQSKLPTIDSKQILQQNPPVGITAKQPITIQPQASSTRSTGSQSATDAQPVNNNPVADQVVASTSTSITPSTN